MALDKYLFSCYTGLRYSDMTALKPENLILEDGKEWLKFTMIKTGVEVRLPIHLPVFTKALDIIYNYISEKATIFPEQTNEEINDDLKAIATKAISAGTLKHSSFCNSSGAK